MDASPFPGYVMDHGHLHRMDPFFQPGDPVYTFNRDPNCAKGLLMRRYLLWFALVAAHQGLEAQGGGSKCGTFPSPQGTLTVASGYFLDDAQEAIRDSVGISKVDSAATRVVVTNETVCSRLIREALATLRGTMGWQQSREKDFDFLVLQVGPYYAVVVGERLAAGQTNLSRVPMLIFRVSDRVYIGGIMI